MGLLLWFGYENDPDIDDHLALALKRIAGRQGTSFKAIVNEALRAGIEAPPQHAPYRTEVRSFIILSGIDPLKLGQISDEAEDMAKIGTDR
mgnify:CR=1 FL=1